MSKYKIQVRGACLQGNCDCAQRDGMIVDEGGLPAFHDGCTCVAVRVSRLDEIRERYEWSRKVADATPTGASTAHEDIGYLLGLLVEHPASEPPDRPLNVLVLNYGVWLLGFYSHGQWRSGVNSAEILEGVTVWRKLPPVPCRAEIGDE